jgi:hypothetical protein
MGFGDIVFLWPMPGAELNSDAGRAHRKRHCYVGHRAQDRVTQAQWQRRLNGTPAPPALGSSLLARALAYLL